MPILSIDETAGQQTSTNELNTTSITALPTVFQNVLLALEAPEPDPLGTVMGIALSGYSNATPAGTTFISFSGPVQDVGFLDKDGNSLNGDASGLETTDGTAINLFTHSTNNNVVLGRRADNGDVVFAMYLETLKADNSAANTANGFDIGATKGKLWVVQYEPLSHLDSDGDPVDLVSLSGVMRLGINSLVVFDATKAPSGNVLFMMVGDGTPADGEAAFVVTGKTPANQSDGVNISTGSTVNSSKGGGPTTFGTDSQMVIPGKGLYFTFVTLSQASVDYTIPNLTSTEAGVEANIQFREYLPVTSAKFDVVQTQPNSETGTMTLHAYNTDENAKGTAFIDDILTQASETDEQVNIFSISITRTTKQGNTTTTTGPFTWYEAGSVPPGHTNPTVAGLTVTFSGDTVTIVGVNTGDSITYSTGTLGAPANHNRLFIDNPGNSDANLDAGYDIGGFMITSGSLTSRPLDNVDFYDDVPSADVTRTANLVTLDETQGAKAGDSNAAADDITATNTDPFAGAYGTPFGALSGIDLVDTSHATGVDSDGATTSLALRIDNVSSGLSTVGGVAINLFLETDGTVTGRAGALATSPVAFAIKLDGDGKASVAQYLALAHTNPNNHDDQLDLTGRLSAVGTIQDGDKDTSTDPVDIGAAIRFDDDGPSVTANTTTVPTLTTDDTDIPDSDGPTSFAGLFGTPSFGRDGFKDSDNNSVQDSDAVVYALGASTTGADSQLVDSLTGRKIFLFLQSGVVNGRVASPSNTADSGGDVAFSISVDATSGAVSLSQARSVIHNDPNDPVESGASAATLAASLVTLNIEAYDDDGDKGTASRDIGDAFRFEDDGPSVDFGNLVGTGTTLPQVGFWTHDAGKDALGTTGLDITLDSFTLIKPDNSTVAGTITEFGELSGSPDGNGAYLFGGKLTGDFDNNASTGNTTVDFTLTAYANNRYALDLVQGFASTTTTSTANGGLGAGGPDPVQTLFIPKPPATPIETVVFFSAQVAATTAQIQEGLGSGATDLTEAAIEATLPNDYVDSRSMNVSTSGIGVDNNLLEGDAVGGTPGGTDESFVVNPLNPVNQVRVTIDNSVQGYSYSGGEELLYRVFFIDGTVSANTLVTTDLGLTHKGQPNFFLIDGGGKQIDAVQLTMAKGDIKVPEIQFVTLTDNLANDVRLNFTATVTDRDGDKATDQFSATLYGNEVSNPDFDFVLNGTASVAEAFDIDLQTQKNRYQVTGFDTTTDRLVLIGDAAATVQNIDNDGDDAIVTIQESGAAQLTTVTVVGVDLLATHVVLG